MQMLNMPTILSDFAITLFRCHATMILNIDYTRFLSVSELEESQTANKGSQWGVQRDDPNFYVR